MNDPYFEMLINEYAEYIKMMEEFNPIVFDNGNDEVGLSWLVYTKYFCLDLIAHVDPDNVEHRAFVNNLIFWDLKDMSLNEYQAFFDKRSTKEIDALLYSDHSLTQFLVDYDVRHNSDYFYRFISHMCTIADIFSDQSVSFRETVNAFIKDYKESADKYWDTKGASWGVHGLNPCPDVKSELIAMSEPPSPVKKTQNAIMKPGSSMVRTAPEAPKPADSQSREETYSQKSSYMVPQNDSQFKKRVTIPLLICITTAIIGWIASSIGLFIVAIAAFVFFILGLKANKQRCPNCRAWDSIMTIKSDQVDSKRVKVRRNLNSTYYRTSGNATFGSRQVFVNADEITYNEIYRCRNCGYEMKGTRRVIDDGIR